MKKFSEFDMTVEGVAPKRGDAICVACVAVRILIHTSKYLYYPPLAARGVLENPNEPRIAKSALPN